jgi:hypothetical protein
VFVIGLFARKMATRDYPGTLKMLEESQTSLQILGTPLDLEA